MRSLPGLTLLVTTFALAGGCAAAPAPAAPAPASPPPAPPAAAPTAAPATVLVGSWLGTLETPGARLRLSLRFQIAASGELQAVAISHDQGATTIPASRVSFDGKQLRARFDSIRGSFEGQLAESPRGTELQGSWRQGGGTLPLTLLKGARLALPRRPQLPRKPVPYREEEVSFDSLGAGVRLAGTLTLPPGPGPFPAVVLITGSGPQDRDESLFGHKPFLVIADHLARRGIASVRADDRGVGRSSGNFAGATTHDFVDDALGAVAFLRGRPEIARRRIGLVGHSEGGLVAPLAAVRSRDVAFIVLLAAPGLTGEQVLYLQGWKQVERLGAPVKVVARERALQERLYAVLKAEPDNTRAAVGVRAAWEAAGKRFDERQQRQHLRLLTSPWFRAFLTLDPRPVLKKVRCPVLALNGEKDTQVTPTENLPSVLSALRAGGNRRVSGQVLPGLNHLFQTARTGAVAEYAAIEETFAPAALELISDWIARHR